MLASDLSFMPTSYESVSPLWPEKWQAAYRILEQTVMSNHVRVWIKPLQFKGCEENDAGIRVTLAAANDWAAEWVRDHHIKDMEAAFSQVAGKECKIILDIEEDGNQSLPYEPSIEAERKPATQQTPSNVSQFRPSSTAHVVKTGPVEQSVDPRLTFENFVVGASNQFAHASAVAVAEQPARQYNPLFIYSSPGLGKTHLLHAIGNHILKNTPGARVTYLSAERFVNEMIESLQHNRMANFRTKYRDSFDLILIDDIQFIAGKPRTEEEFFHTFNALHSSKRQIVVTSDRPPKEIEKLEERLRTRFEWGLTVDINPPEIETRIAILKAKAERDDIYLPDDVGTFLATYIKSNVRELEGVLIRLQAQASLTGAEISLQMAKHELKNAIPEEGSHFTIEAIQNAVARHFNIKIADLKSGNRSRQFSQPRHITAYLIRKYTGLGLKEIGGYLGGRDHTTIMHACKRVVTDLETDQELREQVESIQNLL